ncbi:putative acetyl-transferase [Encephalitozoon hellem]|uniref:Acetyl-transferase n=1 Tax=Encephalitozoon hellem TaxID=27973 RepID=A0ABY8CPH5_ENCHE|nr:putative acetyl-transferase [Encephalitozoon hellem]
MIMALFIYPLVLGAETYRFVKYFSDEQGIKAPEQIVDDYNEAEGEFNIEAMDFDYIFHNGNKIDIFQYKAGEELIASVFFSRDKFYGIVDRKIIQRNVVFVYTMYVSKRHRGKGYSKRILKDAADSLNKHYGMNGDFLLVLHLNPQDKDMDLAFSVYYNLNFRSGGLSMIGPNEKQYFLEELLQYRNPCNVIDEYDEERDRGAYMVMFCEYPKLFMCEKERYDKLMDYGERLRNILKRGWLQEPSPAS